MDAPTAPEAPTARKDPRPRRRHRILLTLLVLLALPVLLLAAVWLALRFEGVRRTLIDLAAEKAGEAGIRLEARDFHVELLAGVVEIEELRVAAMQPEAAPLVSVPRLHAELVWSSLLTGRPTLRALALDNPVLDLGAPFPTLAEEDESSDDSPPIELRHFSLAGGRVLGAPLAASDGWLSAWHFERAAANGSYQAGELGFELTGGELVAQLEDGREIALAAEAMGTARLPGSFRLDQLKLDGEGFHLEATGGGGTAAGEPLAASFELAAEPGVFLPEGAGSTVKAHGRLDFRRWVGEADVEVRELPAELLEPWLGDGRLAQLGVAGSRLDLDAHLTAPDDAATPLATRGTLTWKSSGTHLADVAFDATLERTDDPTRPDFETLAGTAKIRGHDLPIDLLTPWLERAELERYGAQGTRLDVDADLDLDPNRAERLSGQGSVLWRRDAEVLAEAQVRALPATSASPVRFGVDLTLLPAAPGTRHLVGEIGAASFAQLADGRLSGGVLTLELPDLAAARSDLAARWPALIPAASETWPLAGVLSARAELEGRVRDPTAKLDASWRRAGAQLTLEAEGRPVAQQGEARLEIATLDLALLGPPLVDAELSGTVRGNLEVSGSRSVFALSARLEGDGLRYGEQPEIERVSLEAHTDGSRLDLTRLDLVTRGRELSATGGAVLERPLRSAQLDFKLLHPISSLAQLEGRAELAGGSLHLDLAAPPEIGRGRVVAHLPLGALAALPDLAPTMEGLPVEQAAGLLVIDLDLEHLDAQALLARFEAEGLPRKLEAGVHGQLSIDLAAPAAATGKLVVQGFQLDNGEYQLVALAPLVLTLGEHRLELGRWPLEMGERHFELGGSVELEPGWRLENAPKKLVRALDLDAHGQLEAAILNPFLAGGAATGVVGVEAHVAGSLDAPHADVTLDGSAASIFFLRPYATKLDQVRARLVTTEDGLCFENTSGRLNEGTLELEGCRSPGGDFDLRAFLDRVRYRLDYGLSAILVGNLRFEVPAEGRSKISGNLLLERASIRRELDLNELLKSQLFAPPVLRSTAESPAEMIDLELSIGNLDGLRVRNNLADLRATWQELEVRGTLAAPLVKGVVEADPGGLVYGYGQTLRIDSGRVAFSGLPGAAPTFDWSTTSSFDDPTLAGGPGARTADVWTPGTAKAQKGGLEEQVTLGLAGFVGTQVFGRFGGALGRTRFNYRPALVFFEDDPSGRLTVAQDLSRQVLIAVSKNLRDSQRQIYILDVHGFPALPGVSSQIFSNDEDNVGATLQQTLSFGGGAAREESSPRLHKLRATPPEGISERDLLRASGYARGRPIPEDAKFDLEVDLTDFLRTHGYPEAEADVQLEPRKRNEVDLVVVIEPGPRARFELTGTQPPKAARASIFALYRSDFYEPAALEEMRQQTVLALRSRGFLDPQVSVEVVPDDPAEPRGSRTVRVHSEGGRRVELRTLVFTGLDPGEAEALSFRLPGTAERVELAAGLEAADRRLLRELAGIGYPEAEIQGREISADGKSLRVDLALGPRQTLSEVAIVGAPAGKAASWQQKLPLRVGDPVRSEQLASAAVVLQDELAGLGHTQASVRPVLDAPDPERPYQLALRFEVEPGPISTIKEIEIEGLRKTRPEFVRRLVRLEEGSVLDPEPIATARTRLFASGLFDRVAILRERDSAGDTTLTLDLEEKARYLLSYGVRWESGEGYGVVVDALDRNFLGRGITLGLRGFYTDDDRLARFYSAFPRIFGTRATLEFFLEGRSKDEVIELASLRTNSLEGTLQVSVPITEKLTGRVYGRVRDEHIFELDPFDPQFAFDVRTSTPFLGWQMVYDARDDKTDPTRGVFASADLSGTASFLTSDFEYLRFYGQTHYFRTVARWGGQPVVWAGALRAGWLERFGDTTRLPGVGFLTGGDTSVRGYETESLGLLPGFGVPIGGDAVLVVTSELRFPVWADYLRGVVFVDAGNAWTENADFGSGLAKSVGLGLRGVTPLGLLRLDVAYPLDRPEDEDRRYWIYFGFGNTF